MSKGSGVEEIPTETTQLADPVLYYQGITDQWPSNSQVWWSMKRPLQVGTDKPPTNYLEVFDPTLRFQIATGNSPVSKGHYILKAFQQDRSQVSGVGGLEVVSSNGQRPTTAAFFAGRVFYAGTRNRDFSTKIYFTQILETVDQAAMCYQAADPTAEDIRDLQPSDGGVLRIPEAASIIKLHPMGNSMLVFATNGVWSITGSEGIGFRANDFSVTKVSGKPAFSKLSFVDAEGSPLWWNRSEILVASMGQLETPEIQSLSQNTIQTFYDNIPEQSKKYAKGAYNAIKKEVQWLYRSTETTDNTKLFDYDSALIFDAETGGFTKFSITDNPRISVKGIFNIRGEQVSQVDGPVFVDDDPVLVSSDEVTSSAEERTLVQSVTKYIVDVLDDTFLPEPPDPVNSVVTEDVFVSTDQVFVSTDEVQVTF